jgi:uncharacterized protein YukE
MGDRMWVDTDGLASAVPSLQDLAEQIESVGQELSSRIDSLNEPWGDDKAGKQFATQYVGPMEQLLTGLADAGTVLSEASDGIATSAGGFGATEQQNVDLASDISGSPESGGSFGGHGGA